MRCPTTGLWRRIRSGILQGMDYRAHIDSDPSVLAGKPVVKGTRVAVDQVLDLLSQGWSEADLLEAFPGITPADIRACLAYATATIRNEQLLATDT